MKRVLVNIVCYPDKIENIQELLPQEMEVGNKWKAEGLLEQLYMKQDRSGVYMVFKDVDEFQVKQLIPTLPLFNYFEKVDYSSLERMF